MKPEERKRTLNSILRHYLAKPDPEAWLVAADMMEEWCDGGDCCTEVFFLHYDGTKTLCRNPCHDRAALWRSRGRWLWPILDGFGSRRPGGIVPHGEPTAVTLWSSKLVGDVILKFTPRKKTDLVKVTFFGGETPATEETWSREKGDRYLVRRAVILIDWLHDQGVFEE